MERKNEKNYEKWFVWCVCDSSVTHHKHLYGDDLVNEDLVEIFGCSCRWDYELVEVIRYKDEVDERVDGKECDNNINYRWKCELDEL